METQSLDDLSVARSWVIWWLEWKVSFCPYLQCGLCTCGVLLYPIIIVNTEINWIFDGKRDRERENILTTENGSLSQYNNNINNKKNPNKIRFFNHILCLLRNSNFIRSNRLVGLMSDVLLEMRRNQNMYWLSHYYTGIHIRRVCFVELTPIHIPITFVFRRSLYASFSTALIQSIVFSFVCIFYFCSVCVYIECLNVTNLYQVGSHQSIVSRVFDAHWI